MMKRSTLITVDMEPLALMISTELLASELMSLKLSSCIQTPHLLILILRL